MLFKLSIRNMKKSFKDYAIYFLTLVLGVAIFYMFNSIDSQQAMLEVSQSTRKIIKLMISMLGYVSVFVAVVLGLLIVYANNFLIFLKSYLPLLRYLHICSLFYLHVFVIINRKFKFPPYSSAVSPW